VKVAAQELGLPVRQPARINAPEEVAALAAVQPDLIVVVAYGAILSRAVLDVPARGCLNVHFSLLPKYRGAAPVQWTLIRGETETGVTTMLMDEGLDTGDVLQQRVVAIEPTETAADLLARLAQLAPEVLRETILAWRAGALTPQPQDPAQATLAPMLRKEDGALDWTRPAAELLHQMRGMMPWPGVFTFHRGQPVKVWEAVAINNFEKAGGSPGEVVEIRTNQGLVVQTGQGVLLLQTVQAPGGKRIRGDEYATGHGLSVGERLGP
jgi:methionyl-tRNA formyltransferase